MFSKNYVIIMILFVGSILSSDNTSEKEVRNNSHAIVKKFVIPGLVGVSVAVLSEKAVFLAPNAESLDGFLGSFSGWLLIPFANFKVISVFLSQGWFDHKLNKKIPGILSVENGQRICTLISGLHGFAAAAACRYGLNRFFPGSQYFLKIFQIGQG